MRSFYRIVALIIGLIVPSELQAQTVSKILGRDSVTVADVLPANTAPTATDRPLVVTLSPNSPMPAGSQDVNLVKVGGAAIAIGQAAMAASLPVAIASNQSAIAITAASLPLPTGAATAALQTTGNVSLSSIDGKTPALVGGRVPVDAQVTSSVLPAGAATAAAQATGNASLASIDGKLTSPITVTGPLTDAQLRAVPVPMSGTVSATQGTSPWVVSGTVTTTPGGTQNVNLTQVGGAAVALGQTLMMASIPVAIASDQTAITVAQATAANLNAQVVGNAAAGAASSGNPVQIAGSDGGSVRRILTDASGRTITIGTLSDNSANPTTKNAVLSARANASPPTWTEGNVVPLSVDLAGFARVRTQAGTAPTTVGVALTTTGTNSISANAGRKALKIYSRTTNLSAVLCVYFDGITNVTSEATASFMIQPGQTWEMPWQPNTVEYTGQINCAMLVGTGNIQVTQVL